ncbi:hypothetical protein HXX76_014213 [Chlamydomonas incerta]|uniref:NADH:ubiquinone reductase (non-electrogenic) n=1 Tax=Chlamydomonas incerta TaxID=51695 RepID=A0A835SM43_CHLIN|nr:hypothetical protein HXX76_014213 [Chlamydomonas incerta]|eukprot:KAG2424789.1 hypothetical protein HXX76_014213 [Chlamydomonas incerta]
MNVRSEARRLAARQGATAKPPTPLGPVRAATAIRKSSGLPVRCMAPPNPFQGDNGSASGNGDGKKGSRAGGLKFAPPPIPFFTAQPASDTVVPKFILPTTTPVPTAAAAAAAVEAAKLAAARAGGATTASVVVPAAEPQTAAPAKAVPHPHAPQFFPKPGEPAWPPKRSFTAIVLDKCVDTCNYVEKHVRRMNLDATKLAAGAGTATADPLVPGDNGRMRLRASTKPVILVLGSGWGAHAFIKSIDTDTYDVVVVSPRNHFLFTPMLPSTAVGTVEFRSLLEPIRTSNPCVTYLEAECDSLDPHSKVAVCSAKFCHTDGRRPQFEVQYDRAVIAVGEQPATFGIPGVRENCFFMKEVSDAVGLRKRIAEKFELAALPGTTEEERQAALHFVVVGGGPTGVEFAGTLSDFVREDLKKKYPALMKYVKVTLLNNLPSILTQFDAKLQKSAASTLVANGVEVRVNVSVVGVTADKVQLGGGEELPYGVCVWSAGNMARPLTKHIASQVPEQAMAAEASKAAPNSKLCVDSFLRVVGATDLLALGDCSLVLGNRLPPTAQVAGQQGSYLANMLNGGYSLGVGGYNQPPPYMLVQRNRLQAATENNDDLRWLATAMMGGKTRIEVAADVSDALFRMDCPPWVRRHSESFTKALPLDAPPSSASRECNVEALTEAAAAAGGADSQAVRRARAACLESYEEEIRAERSDAAAAEVRYYERPFEFLNLGIMAYVGHERALTQVEAFDVINLKLAGTLAFLLWKSVYITKQVSFRNRVLILFDWMKTRVFGRDISLW